MEVACRDVEVLICPLLHRINREETHAQQHKGKMDIDRVARHLTAPNKERNNERKRNKS
jgi:hypothetical protein